MPNSSRRVAAIFGAMLVTVCAPALLASHPHDPAPATEPEMPVIIESIDITPEDIAVREDIAQKNGESPMTDLQAQGVETQDFDVNDFLGADGLVDVEKLRAYENSKADYIAQNSKIENSNDEAANDSFFADLLKDFQAGQNSEAKKRRGEPMHSGAHHTDPSPSDLPAKDTIKRLMGGDGDEINAQTETGTTQVEPGATYYTLPPKPPAPPSSIEQNSDTDAASALKAKRARNKLRRQSGKKRGRTITLSGETTVHIGPGGDVTITNNGEAVLPLKMTDDKSGSASAMVMDGGKPAKITVHKKMTNKNGKRKVRVEVEMESDIVD